MELLYMMLVTTLPCNWRVRSTQTNECCSSFRQLWVWMHASAFNEGYDALKFACQELEVGALR
uniref:Uncharacterized protein n=1 Tax=Vitis vinifera TaxID=29760 RepID=F6HS99_VITVI